MSQAPAPKSTPGPNPGLDAQGLPHGYRLRPDWEVTPRQLKAMIDNGEELVLVDCRTPLEYQTVRFPQGRLIPLQEALSGTEDVEELRGKRVVVHCHHGIRSLQMAMFLRQQGVEGARSLAGGIDLWAIDIDPQMRRY